MEMLRWSTADALRLYARLNTLESADWRGAAGGAYVDSVRSATILVEPLAQGGGSAQRARLLEAAQCADVARVDPSTLPRLDVHDVVGALHASEDAMASAATR
eukprot:353453-Pleurochrysis_carterae.AAC.1